MDHCCEGSQNEEPQDDKDQKEGISGLELLAVLDFYERNGSFLRPETAADREQRPCIGSMPINSLH